MSWSKRLSSLWLGVSLNQSLINNLSPSTYLISNRIAVEKIKKVLVKGLILGHTGIKSK